jgi:hypothetical protein
MADNVSRPNLKQMAEKLSASVCVLENLLNSSQGERKIKPKTERTVALQFPEDFFQEPRDVTHRQLCSAGIEKQTYSNIANFSTSKQMHTFQQSNPAQEVLPESQLKLHQSILNFQHFNCSLKPLLAMLEFVLQDGSGSLF